MRQRLAKVSVAGLTRRKRITLRSWFTSSPLTEPYVRFARIRLPSALPRGCGGIPGMG